MRAGRLRGKVLLQRPVVSNDALAGKQISYTDVGFERAGIEPLRSREFFEAQQNNAEITLRIVIRYRSDVDADWRVVDQATGLAYEVVGQPIDPDMRHKELHLMCRRLK